MTVFIESSIARRHRAITKQDRPRHLGRHYVLYINHRYDRSGTLWEGRYKASWYRNRITCSPVIAISNSIRCGPGWSKVNITRTGRLTGAGGARLEYPTLAGDQLLAHFQDAESASCRARRSSSVRSSLFVVTQVNNRSPGRVVGSSSTSRPFWTWAGIHTVSSSVQGTHRRSTSATARVSRAAPSMLAMVHPATVVIVMQRWLVKGLLETEK